MTEKKSARIDLNLQVIFSVTIMSVLGSTSISPAFPRIVKELGVSTKDIGLLLTVFTLPGIFLTPILGVVADRFGRKIVLIPSLILFSVAGVLCGFTNNFNILLLLRFLEGVGAASLGSLNIVLIGDLYENKRRTTLLGYNTSILSLGTTLFPFIGGSLAVFGWYYPFFLPVFGFPVGLFVMFKLKDKKLANSTNVKTYLLNAIKKISRKEVVGLFLSSGSSFIIIFGVFLTYLPFLAKQMVNDNPFIIGVLLSSMSLSATLIAFWMGKITEKFNEKIIIKAVFIIYTISQLAMIISPNIYLLFLPTILFGVNQGLNIPSVQTLLSSYSSDEHRAAILSLNRMIAQGGQTIGPLLMGYIYFIFGLTSVFVFGAIITLVVFFILLKLL